jgi:hypothetical protein
MSTGIGSGLNGTVTSMTSALPIHVYPQSFNFIADDTNTHRQVITLFNPHDYSIRYKVLTNEPKKYTVAEPEGTLKAKSSTDL